jgi:hypothetical protein
LSSQVKSSHSQRGAVATCREARARVFVACGLSGLVMRSNRSRTCVQGFREFRGTRTSLTCGYAPARVQNGPPAAERGPEHELPDRRRDRWASRPAPDAVIPLTGHEFAIPANSVAGVTVNTCAQRCRGTRRESAANHNLSMPACRTIPTWRRRTAFSWRNTNRSTSLDARRPRITTTAPNNHRTTT